MGFANDQVALLTFEGPAVFGFFLELGEDQLSSARYSALKRFESGRRGNGPAHCWVVRLTVTWCSRGAYCSSNWTGSEGFARCGGRLVLAVHDLVRRAAHVAA